MDRTPVIPRALRASTEVTASPLRTNVWRGRTLPVGLTAVGRIAVPEPGTWVLAQGNVGVVLVRYDDDLALLRQQFAVLSAMADPRLPRAVALDEGAGALVLAAAHGPTLEEVVSRRQREAVVLTPATLVDVLMEIGQALVVAHDAGFVHGHLDPSRVVLASTGQLVVFGIGNEGPTRQNWLAPERARGLPPSEATDQWALGALGIGLVLGHGPWRSASPEREAAVGDLTGPVAAIAAQWSALGRVLGRLTAPVPTDRFRDLRQALQALTELFQQAQAASERVSLGAALAALAGAGLVQDAGTGSAGTTGSFGISRDTRAGRALPPGAGPPPPPDPTPLPEPVVARPVEQRPKRPRQPVHVDVTDPVGWFESPPALEPRVHNPPLGPPGPPLSPPPSPPIVRVASVLAAAMVALLVVWLFVRVL